MSPPRIVIGMLPSDFAGVAAPRLIELAATAVAAVAAAGNNDPAMVQKALRHIPAVLDRLRPEDRDLLMSVADELVECLRDGKDFAIFGGDQGHMSEIPETPEGLLGMWTIFENPRDMPNAFVARLFVIGDGARPMATNQTMVGADLKSLRAAFQRAGFTCRPRQKADDPSIVEVWL